MISFAKMSIIADNMLRLFNVNDFLKMLTIFKSKLFKLTKRCLKREILNSFNFDEVIFINDEELNLKSKIFKNK